MEYDVRIVYDDMAKKCEAIEDVIGSTGFANVVVKKKKLQTYYMDNLISIFSKVTYDVVANIYDLDKLYHELSADAGQEIKIIHCFSNFIFSDFEQAQLSIRKLEFIDRPYKMVSGQKIVGILFPSVADYVLFLKQALKEGGSDATLESAREVPDSFAIVGMTDIGEVGNFIQCVTGNFDARFFNSLEGDDYIVVKRSSNKKKIRMEYQFYQLLPEDMKYWFVMPFHYQEDEKQASYAMERLHMTDVAVKWVHGSFSESEFEDLLDKYFYFFNHRHKRSVSHEEYKEVADQLYVQKVDQRISELTSLPEYASISKLLQATGIDMNELFSYYLSLKEKLERKKNVEKISVIGHGDPCFSNALYNKSSGILKFIDPKGALDQSELWTNPYYDIAKLSHSICGLYDFFNNGLFEIGLSESLEYTLKVDFDNHLYQDLFKTILEENGYDYQLVRLYEASLFLSMLPLHIDAPYKVLGFILNAKNILEELSGDA